MWRRASWLRRGHWVRASTINRLEAHGQRGMKSSPCRCLVISTSSTNEYRRNHLALFRWDISPKRHYSPMTPRLQAPQKAVTAALPTGSGTFLTGTASGRILSFSAAGEASHIGGDGHLSLVTSLSSGKDGKVFSAGFDDRLREIDGPTFTLVGIVQ